MDHSGRLLLGALLVILPVVSSAGLSVPVAATSLFAVAADTAPPAGSYQHAIEPAAESAFVEDMPYIVSQRLGEQIDIEERRYFHLFPYVRRFEKAVAYRRSSGEVAFVITRRDSAGGISDTTITTSAETAEQLGVFVNNYEPICSRKHYFDHQIIKDHAGLPAVSCTTTRPVMVTLTDGTEYMAQILHAGDSVLVLWKDDGVYDWQTVSENGVSLPWHMINAVIYKQDARFKRAMTCGGLGCLIGAGAGALMAAGLETEPAEDPITGMITAYVFETARLGLPLGGAVTGGLVGGIIGAVTGAAKGSPIHGDRQVYCSARPLMNQHAVFPYSVPPEIKHLLETKYSPAGRRA